MRRSGFCPPARGSYIYRFPVPGHQSSTANTCTHLTPPTRPLLTQAHLLGGDGDVVDEVAVQVGHLRATERNGKVSETKKGVLTATEGKLPLTGTHLAWQGNAGGVRSLPPLILRARLPFIDSTLHCPPDSCSTFHVHFMLYKPTHLHARQLLQLLLAADDHYLLAVLARPDGDGRAPEPACVCVENAEQ